MNKKKIRPRALDSGGFPRPRNFFYRLASDQRFLAIIGLAFLLLIIVPLVRIRTQQRLVEKEIDDVKEEIANFESQNQEFQELKEYLQSQQSQEERARLNLNLKKPGEQLIVINSEAPASNDFSALPANGKSNWEKWQDYFFGL
jgi:cell division protein FtsB